MYYGETNIYQENLNSFLKIGEELGLQGLAEGGINPSEIEAKSTTRNVKPILPVKTRKQENHQHNESDHFKSEPM